ncbi:MAG TPA: metal ABC transporter permease [Bauldia sp.]|nr:metal ABC transporter permease [Bauldia sp.]
MSALLTYDFVLRAFAASGIVAIVAGIIGYFLVLRGQTFAGHALSHIGFAGATGAALVGVSPLAGLITFVVAAGTGIGLLGERMSGRDVTIGMVLSVSLGFGLLFLSLTTGHATAATTLLFGNVLAVTPSMLATLALLGVVTLAGLGWISRPLVFATLQPELAEARGVSLRAVGTLFLALVALATAQSIQIVGVLLVFTLMVGPPAAAQLLTRRLGAGVALSAGLALAQAWLGIVLAFYTDWPTSFWITALAAAVYAAAAAWARMMRRN